MENLRGEIAALRVNCSILQATYFESLAPNSIVGSDYVAYRFGCSESAAIRGRFQTNLIPRFRQKPIAFIKSDVDATFKQLTRPTAEKAAEIRHRAKRRKKINDE